MVSRLEADPPLSPDGTNDGEAARSPNGSRVEIEAKFLIESAEQASELIDSLNSQVASRTGVCSGEGGPIDGETRQGRKASR